MRVLTGPVLAFEGGYYVLAESKMKNLELLRQRLEDFPSISVLAPRRYGFFRRVYEAHVASPGVAQAALQAIAASGFTLSKSLYQVEDADESPALNQDHQDSPASQISLPVIYVALWADKEPFTAQKKRQLRRIWAGRELIGLEEHSEIVTRLLFGLVVLLCLDYSDSNEMMIEAAYMSPEGNYTAHELMNSIESAITNGLKSAESESGSARFRFPPTPWIELQFSTADCDIADAFSSALFAEIEALPKVWHKDPEYTVPKLELSQLPATRYRVNLDTIPAPIDGGSDFALLIADRGGELSSNTFLNMVGEGSCSVLVGCGRPVAAAQQLKIMADALASAGETDDELESKWLAMTTRVCDVHCLGMVGGRQWRFYLDPKKSLKSLEWLLKLLAQFGQPGATRQ